MTSNSCSSCLCLLSAGTGGVCHHPYQQQKRCPLPSDTVRCWSLHLPLGSLGAHSVEITIPSTQVICQVKGLYAYILFWGDISQCGPGWSQTPGLSGSSHLTGSRHTPLSSWDFGMDAVDQEVKAILGYTVLGPAELSSLLLLVVG